MTPSVRPFIVASAVIFLSACVHPTTVRSFDELRAGLHAGDSVDVLMTTETMAGRVLSSSPDSLAITSGGTRRDIARSTIRRVEKLERPWRRGTLIGLAVGAATGGAIVALSDCPGGDPLCGAARVVGFAGTSLVGAGIGAAAAAKRRPTLIYLAPQP